MSPSFLLIIFLTIIVCGRRSFGSNKRACASNAVKHARENHHAGACEDADGRYFGGNSDPNDMQQNDCVKKHGVDLSVPFGAVNSLGLFVNNKAEHK